MKKLPILAALAAGIYLITRFISGKKKALENLKVVPKSIAIDSTASAESGWSELFYKVKITLINNELQPIRVHALDADIYIKGILVGKIIRDSKFIVPGRSKQTISVNTSITIKSMVQSIIEIIQGGAGVSVTIKGEFTSDLGPVPFQFTKSIA
jgi:LEA14-like dessication related protein